MKWRGTGIVLRESRAPQRARTLPIDRYQPRSDWVASKVGLPAIGSKLLNAHGIEWVVSGHVPAPTYDTLHRWRTGQIEFQMDMYPLIEPQNLSPRLSEFMLAINRCTTKHFGIFDTMPGRRRDGHVPGANSIDTLCNPEANLLFLDAARVHETIIAHEFGHAWVQYVDDCEDFRTMKDSSNPQRMRQVSFVQSFVLDLKVNDLLRRKGFNMNPIEEDQDHSLANLAEMLACGRRFELAREEVFYALQVADAIVRRDGPAETAHLVRLDSSLELIRESKSPLAVPAEAFASSVMKYGYDARGSIISAIDDCLLASFGFCGESIDLDRELIAVNPPDPDVDKFPEWLPVLPPKVKCVVGKHMAQNDISSDWHHAANPSVTGRARVTFRSPDGDTQKEMLLTQRIGPPTRYADLPEIVAENLAIKHRNLTGSYQIFGGPPHRNPDNPPEQPQPPIPGHEGFFPDGSGGRQATTHRPGDRHALGGTPESSALNLHAPATAMALGHPDWNPSDLFGVPTATPGFSRHGRPYMAGLGRWTTQARLQEQLEGEQPYAYAECNPVTYVDPSGLSPSPKHPKLPWPATHHQFIDKCIALGLNEPNCAGVDPALASQMMRCIIQCEVGDVYPPRSVMLPDPGHPGAARGPARLSPPDSPSDPQWGGYSFPSDCPKYQSDPCENIRAGMDLLCFDITSVRGRGKRPPHLRKHPRYGLPPEWGGDRSCYNECMARAKKTGKPW